MSVSRDHSEALLERLLELHPKRIDLSLGRMQRLLEALGKPQNKCPPILHVAGTNGKGSTLAFTRAMLEAQGHTVHVYNSPHLVRFHERITLAGDFISEEKLAHYLSLCERANDGQDITFFEITTAAAFCAFAEHHADYLLLEVGLGGRLDATNLITPTLAAITPISRDHEDFLGSDLAGIAAEKAGIIKPNCPVISAPQDLCVRPVIEQAAEKYHAPLAMGGQDWSVGLENDRLVFQDQNALLDLPLPSLTGPHQITNAGTAIAIARALKVSDAAIAKGLETAKWPARLQKLPTGPMVDAVRNRLPNVDMWLDGGHNQAAAQMLANWLHSRQEARPLHLILGLLASKSKREFLAAFAAHPSLLENLNLHFVPIANIPNALSPEALQETAVELGLSGRCHRSLDDALHGVQNQDALILIAGSLYLAGEVLRANEKAA
ncbi:bifunctional folylpolyglutamate synthase/dihydrofolate synthase [Alphaproteobacteria bacterium]|nr:bifunctional folylpolyglutamate synthase/dihydrofolate synthase [Alphaproteobacteria bacterium]